MQGIAHDDMAAAAAGLGAVIQVLHKRPVDLEGVDGQVPQVGQRRIAATEIVDSDADARKALLEFGKLRGGVAEVLHEQVFGDLELEPVRDRAPLAGCPAESLVERP